MDLDECRRRLRPLLRPATVCFVISDGAILLGLKKRGLGEGLWNGPGGKVEDGESIELAAIRETQEEMCIVPRNLRATAVLDFYFPDVPMDLGWNQRAHIFMASEYEGKPVETDEMAPKWFPLDKIPFDRMWEDDEYWLPAMLKGNFVNAEFVFDANQRMGEYAVRLD